jgi:HK97 family phage major capsid protein
MVRRQETGALRKLARIVKMQSDSLAYPKQTAGTSVFYPGEEGSITASDLDFGRANLIPKKRAIYSLVSSELRDDSAVSIMDLLASDMGHQFALKEDQEFVAGDGTSTYGGVLGVRPAIIAATASIFTPTLDEDSWDELTYGSFAGVMATLPAKYRVAKNLKWLCSPAFKWAVMDRLAIASNGAVSQVFVDGIMQDRFLGHEVVLSDDMPSTTAVSQVCCIFGNFDRAVLLGERTEVRIATSEHIAFQTDQTAVRATVRYDIAVHEAGDTSAAGAIVALATHS